MTHPEFAKMMDISALSEMKTCVLELRLGEVGSAYASLQALI